MRFRITFCSWAFGKKLYDPDRAWDDVLCIIVEDGRRKIVIGVFLGFRLRAGIEYAGLLVFVEKERSLFPVKPILYW